jgi:hypothetical protein
LLTPPDRAVVTARTFPGAGQEGKIQSGLIVFFGIFTTGLYEPGHIIGQGNLPFNGLLRLGMDESQSSRMQGLAPEFPQGGIQTGRCPGRNTQTATVDRVPH